MERISPGSAAGLTHTKHTLDEKPTPSDERWTPLATASPRSRAESTPPLPSCEAAAPSSSGCSTSTSTQKTTTHPRPRASGRLPPELFAAATLFIEGLTLAADVLAPLPS